MSTAVIHAETWTFVYHDRHTFFPCILQKYMCETMVQRTDCCVRLLIGFTRWSPWHLQRLFYDFILQLKNSKEDQPRDIVKVDMRTVGEGTSLVLYRISLCHHWIKVFLWPMCHLNVKSMKKVRSKPDMIRPNGGWVVGPLASQQEYAAVLISSVC